MIDSISQSEYSAVRDTAGLIDLSARGRILVSGSEAAMFLNGLITNDVKTLPVNSWMPAAFANVQGRLLAVVRVIHREDGFLIDTEQVTRETVINLLEKFTLAGDFKVADLTDSTALFSVQGPKAAEVVRATLGEAAAVTHREQVRSAPLNDRSATLIRATHTAEDGFDLFIERDGAATLHHGLTGAGATTVSDHTFETLRIEAGVPRYGIDMDENNVVTETNLDDAVSFTKGCYLGQEIIVRIKHRGHVAKKLTGIVLGGAPSAPRSAQIVSTDGKEIGRVTSSIFSPRLECAVALGYVKYDYLAAGTEVKVFANDGEIKATVTELPFVQGSWQKQSAP